MNNKKEIKIESSEFGLSLELIEHEDIDKLREWKNAHRESFFYKEIITSEQQEKWFNDYLAREDDFMFVVKFDNKIIGCIGYRFIDDAIDIYNFILGDKNYQGKGIVGNAARMLWRYLKENYNQDITARVVLNNEKTINWYLKNGWEKVREESDHVLLRLLKLEV